MKILFLHRNFPAQFRHLATFLAKDKNNTVVYLTNRKDFELPNIKKVLYDVHREVNPSTHHYLKFTEEALLHGQAALRSALQMKASGFYPDIIIGHSWGPVSFMKDVFPNAKLIAYIEWFYNALNSDIDFVSAPDIDTMARTRYKNSHILVDLYTCDKILTPTKWQLKQIPHEFHQKAEVIHEGVDTDYFVENKNTVFKIPSITLSHKDEVVVYATRGMEPYRGFPQFMMAASEIQKRRPNSHIVVAGEDRVCYGSPLPDKKTFKEFMLEKLEFDQSRLHFTGALPYSQYLKLLQASAVHVYLTYPFVLSWSMLEAMSCEGLLLASDTPPVREVVRDDFNGVLFNFFKPQELADKIEFALTNRHDAHFEEIRKNARQTIIQDFDKNNMLKKQIEFINNL